MHSFFTLLKYLILYYVLSNKYRLQGLESNFLIPKSNSQNICSNVGTEDDDEPVKDDKEGE